MFWGWQCRALIQSGTLFAINILAYDSTSLRPEGLETSIWAFGISVYASIVMVVNFKLVLLVRSWTWLHMVTFIFSIGAFSNKLVETRDTKTYLFPLLTIVVIFFVSIQILASPTWSVAGSDYTGETTHLFFSYTFWLAVVGSSTASLLIDYVFDVFVELQLLPCCRRSRAFPLFFTLC